MTSVGLTDRCKARYSGLQMTADEYVRLPEDSLFRYELVNGVVLTSPNPTFRHQVIVVELCSQVRNHLGRYSTGTVVFGVDVRLGDDRVYRPDVVCLQAQKAARCGNAVMEVPDLVAEVISPEFRCYDSQTRRGDYEAADVSEYWLIDPDRNEFHFLVLEGGAYREVSAAGEHYASTVLTGFELDLSLVRRCF